MDKKVCNICHGEKPLSGFPKKGKNRRRGYCKDCGKLKVKGLIKRGVLSLDTNSDIKIRGKSKEKKFTSYISSEKAQKLVDNRMAVIIHPTLIHKTYEYREFRKMILDRDKDKCYYCNKPANTLDHVLPKSSGGMSTFTNCVACCLDCNAAKRNLHLERFLYLNEPFHSAAKTKEDYALDQLMDMDKLLEGLKKNILVHLTVLSDTKQGINHKQIDNLKNRLEEINQILKEFEGS